MARALITGGNGLVGNELCASLLKKGFEVYNLSRSGSAPKGAIGFRWDYESGYVNPKALENIDVVFHLAGASVANKKWTSGQKKIIIDSRVKTAELLYESFKTIDYKPKEILSASGTGFYGFGNGTQMFNENDPLGSGFLAEVTQKWEDVISKFLKIGITPTSLRIGMVLSKNGGALDKLAMPIKLGIGSPIGSGNQLISWIHIDDLVQTMLFVLDNEISGVFNCVATETPSNKEFTKALAKQLNRVLIFPNVPGFLLEMLLGQMAKEIILGGNASSNQKLKEAGFVFKHENLKGALADLLV